MELKSGVKNQRVESWPGVTIHVELWAGVTIQRGIITLGHNLRCGHDPGLQLNVELWPGLTMQRWIMIKVAIQREIV